MTVKALKDILADYNDDAEVVVVDFSNGREFDFAVGDDDNGSEYTKTCTIGLC